MICVLCGVIKYLTDQAEKCPTNDVSSIKTSGRIKLTAVMFVGNSALWSDVHRCRGGWVSGTWTQVGR